MQYLRGKIKGSSFLRPFRSLITVNTVDGFQGQERDVIFISLVRANEDGQIGFLNDLRRMNVAITRARMKLVILGDASTLAKHPFYKRLMLFIKKEDYSNSSCVPAYLFDGPWLRPVHSTEAEKDSCRLLRRVSCQSPHKPPS